MWIKFHSPKTKLQIFNGSSETSDFRLSWRQIDRSWKKRNRNFKKILPNKVNVKKKELQLLNGKDNKLKLRIRDKGKKKLKLKRQKE